MDEMKICPYCNVDPVKSIKNGRCAKCLKKYRREYYLAHKDEALRQAKEYAAEHKEHKQETTRIWQTKNKDRVNAGHRKRYDTEKERQRKIEYRLRNEEKVAEVRLRAGKTWHKNNREKTAAHKAWARYCKSHDVAIPCYCQHCHKECKPHAHHYLGYTKEHWLDVIFLCPVCHRRTHSKYINLDVTNLDISNFTEPIDTGSLALCDSNNHISQI